MKRKDMKILAILFFLPMTQGLAFETEGRPGRTKWISAGLQTYDRLVECLQTGLKEVSQAVVRSCEKRYFSSSLSDLKKKAISGFLISGIKISRPAECAPSLKPSGEVQVLCFTVWVTQEDTQAGSIQFILENREMRIAAFRYY